MTGALPPFRSRKSFFDSGGYNINRAGALSFSFSINFVAAKSAGSARIIR
jgi:hypothetical protein